MTDKVFLFGNNNWLYCSDVSYNNGTWRAWVVNGNWHLMYDAELKGLFACIDAAHANSLVAVSTSREELTWACDADLKHVGRWYYNEAIQDAQTRYKNGEPANYVIQPKKVKARDEYDDIAF